MSERKTSEGESSNSFNEKDISREKEDPSLSTPTEQGSVIAHSSLGAEGGTHDSNNEEEDGETMFSSLLSFMKAKLHISDDESSEQMLLPADLDSVVKYIKSGKCKNIISMAGAGISTSAGIPDFRSPDTGLYHNLQKYDLPYPEAIFEMSYFKKNPKPFFALAKELYPSCFEPTPCHYLIRLMHEKGMLRRHYTQNIDTLEHEAGVPADKLVEAHGSFRTSHCLQCRKAYSQEWMKAEVFADKVPTCTSCSSVVKPDIVFFGENLPKRFFQCLSTDFRQCDLLVIMGTSLSVQPFASLVEEVPSTCPRLLINCENSLKNSFTYLFGKKRSQRDVVILGDCDEGCRMLADKLGWKEELEKLVAEGKKNTNEK